MFCSSSYLLLPAHLPSCPSRVTQPVAHPRGDVSLWVLLPAWGVPPPRAGTAETGGGSREEDGEGQTAGAGERRQRGSRGKAAQSAPPGSPANQEAFLPTPLPAGVRGQEPSAETSTAHPARSPASSPGLGAFGLGGRGWSASPKRGAGGRAQCQCCATLAALWEGDCTALV